MNMMVFVGPLTRSENSKSDDFKRLLILDEIFSFSLRR